MFLLSETQTADLQVLQMDVIDEAALALQECSLFVYPIIIIILLPFYLYVILFDRLAKHGQVGLNLSGN